VVAPWCDVRVGRLQKESEMSVEELLAKYKEQVRTRPRVLCLDYW